MDALKLFRADDCEEQIYDQPKGDDSDDDVFHE